MTALERLRRELCDDAELIGDRRPGDAPHEPAPGDDDVELAIEAVREGYLLHYGEPRLLAGHDADLGLLAGDYLYALGLDRLAALGDTGAVATLSELISRCAQLHAEGRESEVDDLWVDAAREVAGLRPLARC